MLKFLKLLTLILCLQFAGCGLVPELDDVLPDKRTEYKKSESLPDLEIPPDLTSEAINDSMAIPAEQQASVSSYRNQQPVAAPAVPAAADEQWVSVRGARTEIWPRLQKFFADKGYGIELNDADLGVMETAWGQGVPVEGKSVRYKFKIFTEPGGTDDVTVLFVSSERQEQSPGADWVDVSNSTDAEKRIAGEMNVYFNGGAARVSNAAGTPAATAAAAARESLAKIEDTGDGRVFLSIPEEFTVAWRNTEAALRRGGFFIAGSDQNSGIYQVTLVEDNRQAEKKGWLSKLAFWKDDEASSRKYRISLTGVGNHTELIVLNDSGDWDSGEEANHILSLISSQYGTQ